MGEKGKQLNNLKGGERMKKFIFCSVLLLAFLSISSVAHADSGLEDREPGKFHFDRAICGEMVLGTKVKLLCFDPETDITGEDIEALTKVFINIAPKIHFTSWLTVVKLSGAGKVFVRLSDGHFIYASGSGKNFADAIKNLEIKMSNLPTKGDGK